MGAFVVTSLVDVNPVSGPSWQAVEPVYREAYGVAGILVAVAVFSSAKPHSLEKVSSRAGARRLRTKTTVASGESSTLCLGTLRCNTVHHLEPASLDVTNVLCRFRIIQARPVVHPARVGLEQFCLLTFQGFGFPEGRGREGRGRGNVDGAGLPNGPRELPGSIMHVSRKFPGPAADPEGIGNKCDRFNGFDWFVGPVCSRTGQPYWVIEQSSLIVPKPYRPLCSSRKHKQKHLLLSASRWRPSRPPLSLHDNSSLLLNSSGKKT